MGKYNKESLVGNYTQEDFLFFFGAGVLRDGTLTSGCLSQFWKCSFSDGWNNYTCAEQYMMYQKASLFGDTEIADKILQATTPKEMKALGRKVRNYDERIWSENRERIVYQGNMLKFGANADLRAYLISTGGLILVEASPYDKIWGIGMDKDSFGIENPNNWKGINLLGFTLMEVRDTLNNQE